MASRIFAWEVIDAWIPGGGAALEAARATATRTGLC